MEEKMSEKPNMVLRTVYISPELDDVLRKKAFADRTSKNDLIRKYLVLGLKMEASVQSGTAISRDDAVMKSLLRPPKVKASPAKAAAKKTAAKAARKG
jgi:hypothetical protein